MCSTDDQHSEQKCEAGWWRGVASGVTFGTEVTNIQSEEPGAGKLHAGICAGGAPRGAFLPRCFEKMIEYMTDILTGTIERGESIGLDQLIWTVDAKEHAIPTAAELNEALDRVGSFTVERESNTIILRSSPGQQADQITDSDISVAMSAYNDMVTKLLNKH